MKIKTGDKFLDIKTGKAYVISRFQPGIKTAKKYGIELPKRSEYRTYEYGKPPLGKYIQFIHVDWLEEWLKVDNVVNAKILFMGSK